MVPAPVEHRLDVRSRGWFRLEFDTMRAHRLGTLRIVSVERPSARRISRGRRGRRGRARRLDAGWFPAYRPVVDVAAVVGGLGESSVVACPSQDEHREQRPVDATSPPQHHREGGSLAWLRDAPLPPSRPSSTPGGRGSVALVRPRWVAPVARESGIPSPRGRESAPITMQGRAFVGSRTGGRLVRGRCRALCAPVGRRDKAALVTGLSPNHGDNEHQQEGPEIQTRGL